MSKIICMASSKGGSGKTVLTATFATFLNELGKKVLIIDTDASTNGLTLMYLKEVMVQNEHAIAASRIPLGTYEVLDSFQPPEIVKLPHGVHLIPATYSFINTEGIHLPYFTRGLKDILARFQDDYDYIFLDAQAGSDNFAHIAIRKDISHEVVIVSEYDPLSAAGIDRLKALFREDLTYNRTWVLLNKLLPDFIQSFSDFLEVAKYLSPIPWNAEVVKAYARRRLALDLQYGNEFTVAIMQTIKVLLGDEIKKEIDEWIENKSAIIREPIQIQYNDAKIQLENLYVNAQKQKTKKKLRTILIALPSIIILLILFFLNINDSESKIIPGSLFIPITTVLFLIIAIFLFDFFDKTLPRKPEEISNFLTRREIKDLEEKLKKLDGMRNAKIDTLIKSRASFESDSSS